MNDFVEHPSFSGRASQAINISDSKNRPIECRPQTPQRSESFRLNSDMSRILQPKARAKTVQKKGASRISPTQRRTAGNLSKEKHVAAFSNLGWRLTAALSQREAAQILVETADELFGWDACTFDLYSTEQNIVTTVLYIDTI